MNESCTNIPSEKDIAAINALFQKCRECSDALTDAYVEWERRKSENAKIRALQEKYQKASKAFDDFKARMGEIKFDTEKGEYFQAKDENGCENFRIKVTLTQTKMLSISSTSEEFALKTAEAAARDGKLTNFSPVKITCEEVSR